MRSPMPRSLRGGLAGVVLVAAVSGLVALLDGYVPVLGLSVLYLLAVLPVAVLFGVVYAVFTAVLGTAVFAFLFVPPRYRFATDDAGELAALAVFLVVAVVVGDLAARTRRQAAESARLSEEQAALRRVATLVARSQPPPEVFAAVTREVGVLSGADLARMERYEADGSVTGVAGWSREQDRLAVGTRFVLEGVSIAALVRQTGGPVRVDSFANATGPIAEEARRVGIRSSVGCPIMVAGRLWGVIAASSLHEAPFPAGTESQMADFTELVATAVANAQNRAELAASRARVVVASDEARRRIERDLHDGAQQRLVSLGLELRAAQTAIPESLPELQDEVRHVADGLNAVVEELRETARGIHPAALSTGGLGPALRTLARRSPVPVELQLRPVGRFPQPVEVAAYYVVSEALTNMAKHAQASFAEVVLDEQDGTLRLSVRDDGVGGAEPGRGSGLVGLRDRVEALGGSIDVRSPAGQGTLVAVELPVKGTD